MRSYAQVVTSIWDDPHFCERSAGAQRTYFMLFSQREITACGMLPLTIKRWAKTLRQNERRNLNGWLQELAAERFVVTDDETEELLVRSFIRWDHGYTNSKRLPVILDTMRAVRSLEIRNVLTNEANRLGIDVSSVFPQVNTLSDALSDKASEGASDTPSDATCRIDRVVVTEVGSTHNPETFFQKPSSGSRGSRLPEDWQPTSEQIAWVKSEFPTVDGRFETEQFKDFWIAKSGADASKIDWPATYRRWIRTASQRTPGRAPSKRATTDIRVEEGMNLTRRLAAQEAETERRQIGA